MNDFNFAFRADFEVGRLYWRNPPKNHVEKVGCEAGYINVGKGKNKSYWHIRVFGKTYKRSRVIFYMVHGRWPEPAVDHINGDSLDDRPCNLRECTFSQNTANSRQKYRRHNLPRGVYPTRQGRFMVRLTKNGISKSLGVYDTPNIALSVYENARKEAFGEFA